MASARLPGLAEIVVPYLSEVGKTHPSGIIAHFLKDGCQRGHIRIVSLLIPAIKGKELLAHLHFGDCLFCEKASLWPGSKGVARKKHRREKNSLGKSPPCFRRMGRAHRAPSLAPLHRNNPVLGQRTACPPDPENEPCLMIFARNVFAFGPGNGRNSIGLTTTCRRVKVGRRTGRGGTKKGETDKRVYDKKIWVVCLLGVLPFFSVEEPGPGEGGDRFSPGALRPSRATDPSFFSPSASRKDNQIPTSFSHRAEGWKRVHSGFPDGDP